MRGLFEETINRLTRDERNAERARRAGRRNERARPVADSTKRAP